VGAIYDYRVMVMLSPVAATPVMACAAIDRSPDAVTVMTGAPKHLPGVTGHRRIRGEHPADLDPQRRLQVPVLRIDGQVRDQPGCPLACGRQCVIRMPYVRTERLTREPPIPSLSCSVSDLADIYEVPEAARREVACHDAGWERRWEAAWRSGGARVDAPVGDLGQIVTGGCQPWRHFTWRTGQRHRPGLQFLVSTGRHHGSRAWKSSGSCWRWISRAA
jgi:hypothetical protein